MYRLNEQQAEAVKYIDTPLLVLAGAGSGKTMVITNKIAYLIQYYSISAHNIVAVTFTNKAAQEMKNRVGKLVQGKASQGLTVATFHNLGLNIIRKEYKTLGYKSGFSIFNAQDVRSLIKDLIQQEVSSNEENIDIIQHTISNWKHDLIFPENALEEAKQPHEQLAARVYEHYNLTLKACNSIDLDDLILQPIALFRENPAVLERWQKKIHYVLVDEYQDTNGAQYELIRKLVGIPGKLTVVGDDDQSIYAWRGARPENFVLLNKDYPSLRIIKLEQNYRSTGRILKIANTLIANNSHIFNKTLWSKLGMGDIIRVIRCRNDETECDRIATEILTHKLRNNTYWKDYAVLYRVNCQSRLLEIKLQRYQIPYHINKETALFASAEVKDIMAYLRLMVNQENNNAFLRIINIPRRKIGPATLKKLCDYANMHNLSLYSACQAIGLQEALTSKYVAKLRQFTDWMDSVSYRCQNAKDPIAIIREMIKDIDYKNWLMQTTTTPAMVEKRMNNVNFLIDSLQQILDRVEEEDECTTVENAITGLILCEMNNQEEEDNDKVHLLTLHTSKGLEYLHIFIMGMEEELLPHRISLKDSHIEEERRLTYVGMTRAKKTLTMTIAEQRNQYGKIVNTTPSRFLDELPQQDLHYLDYRKFSKEQNSVIGNTTLTMLRKQLNK